MYYCFICYPQINGDNGEFMAAIQVFY